MNYKVPNTGNPLLPGDFMVPTKLMVNENYEKLLEFDVSQTESFIGFVADDSGIYSRYITRY